MKQAIISAITCVASIILLSLLCGCTSVSYNRYTGDVRVDSFMNKRSLENFEMVSEPGSFMISAKGYNSEQQEALRAINQALDAYLKTRAP